MKRRHFLAGATAAPAVSLQTASGLQAGFAERDITPETGMEKPGGYGKAFHKVFHDACKVRAAVYSAGGERVALVGIDALMIPRKLVLDVREEVRKRCGIATEAVLLGASHSHSSGPTGMVQPGEYDHAPEFVRRLAYEKSSCADAKYLARVREQLIGAIVDADRSRVDAVCGFGSGHEDKAAFNRRFRMKNGLTATHPGQGNPDIVEAAGPIDPEVGVIGAWDKGGRLLGCVVNYACHATTDPGGISANWIYYLERTIRGALEDKAVVVFLQGASGDVTQVDNLRPYVQPAAKRWAQIVGHRVGAEAVKVLVSAERGDHAPLAARSRVLRIKRRPPSPERVRRCYALAKRDPKEVDATEWTFAKEIVLLDALLQREPEAEVEVQAVQVGPAVFVTNPAEFFCQLGLDIKAGSNFKLTYPVELANGCVGYVPTEEALGPRGGGYETRLTSYSNLQPTAGRQMVNAGIELARALQPGTMPEPPRATPRGVWPYGNVPPELS
jgi:hypothetical protein